MLLADRLTVPDGTAALLLDMDGVLIDTLTMDYEIVNQLLGAHTPVRDEVPRSVIRANFPYAVPEFWRRVLAAIGAEVPQALLDRLIEAYEQARATFPLRVHEGVREVLGAARAAGLGVAVVSNNPERDVDKLLASTGLRQYVDVIVGNDNAGLAPKPAPDTYLEAARRLGAPPDRCAAVEDSLLGAEAASRAGCYTIAVATGAGSFDELAASPSVSRCYTRLAPSRVVLTPGDVTRKTLVSPNDFVSHMVEHVAWRTGCSVDLVWNSDDWRLLGVELGRELRRLPFRRQAAAALGMMDDASCEVTASQASPGGATLGAAGGVDLEWFLSLRSEQLAEGRPLVALLDGIGAGAGLDLHVTVTSFEDPHHTWEAVFRGVGVVIDKLRGGPAVTPPAPPAGRASVERGWSVEHASGTAARLRRETAESAVTVGVALGGGRARCHLEVAGSIHVEGLADLLGELARGAGLDLDVSFTATRLSSSHVVMEDVATVLGRALRAIAVERAADPGIQGAGTSVDAAEDLERRPVRAGVSIEGRKFLKLVPLGQDYASFRRSFLVGHTLPNGLYSEDLDDFIDALAGGLGASIVLHVAPAADPETGWPLVFRALGEALSEALSPNPARRNLIPGVKATLA